MKIDSSKISKGNKINFEEYYKKLNQLKNRLNTNKNEKNERILVYNKLSNKKIFKSDLFSTTTKNEKRYFINKDSKIFDYKKFILKNHKDKAIIDNPYNSATGNKFFNKFFSRKLISKFSKPYYR